jgi:hypothetical protein
MARKSIEEEKERSRANKQIQHETAILRSLKPGDGLSIARSPKDAAEGEYFPVKITKITSGEDRMLTVELLGIKGGLYRIEEEENRLRWYEPRESGELKPSGKVNAWKAVPAFSMPDWWDEE